MASTLSDGRGALVVGLEPDHEERLVGRRDVVDEVEADHRQHALHAGDRLDHLLDLGDDRLGAVERGAFGQAQRGEEAALVLGRQEALGRDAVHPERHRGRDRHGEDDDHGDPDQPADDPGVAVAAPVDGAQHMAHRPRPVSPRFSSTEQSAGLRVSALIAEITIEVETATANWRNSVPLRPGRNATGTNTDSSTRVMAITGPVISAIASLVASGIERSGSLLDHALDVLDHHDRVVDHDADRDHQRQQRHGVGGVADHQHHREGADDRHRHGHEGNQRRAQLAEEQEHHDRHQHEGDDQRMDHLGRRSR